MASKKLEEFLQTNKGKKACVEKQNEIIELIGGIAAILSVYNKKRLLDSATEKKCLAMFGLNKVEKKKPADEDEKKATQQPIESKSNDIQSEMSPQQIQKVWKDNKKQSYDDQAMLFLNVLWAKFETEKNDIFKIFSIYREKHLKFGEQATAVGFGTFCNVLEMCEKDNKRVADCQSKYIGKPSISKRFQALGMKLGGQISLIECLLYIYGENMTDFVSLARSPCDANLRQALCAQAKVKADGLKLTNERDALLVKKETAKPMKKAQIDLDIQRLNNEIQQEGVNVKRANKKQDKLVAAAQQALDKENINGTGPTNWFKQKLGVSTGVRAKAKGQQVAASSGGDYKKQQCSQCNKTAFGKLDNNDGNFYCNDCWAAF